MTAENNKSAKLRQLVYQGNPLIQSRKQFSTIGMRLFILGLMTLNPHLSKKDKFFDKEFAEYVISPSELTKLFDNHYYLNDLQAECDKLFDSKLTLKYNNGDFDLLHIFDVLKYKSKDGLHIQFDSKMKPYLLELVEGGYTAINIEQIFKLTSTYAVRLIELCLQYRNMTKGNVITRALTIEDIRFYLNVPEDAYEGRMSNFRKYVLDEPILEIEKVTDFKMSYKVEKEGRKVKGFIFELDLSKIAEKNFSLNFDEVAKLPISAPYADVYGELMKQGFSAKAAKEILSAVNDKVEVGLRLEYALKILPEVDKKSPIKNKQGFLRKAILENWRVNDIKAKQKMNISESAKIKNQMKLNVLDFEKEKAQRKVEMADEFMEKTGISQKNLQGEEIPIPSVIVKIIQEKMLGGEEIPESMLAILKAFKFTPERFKQVYKGNYQNTAQSSSTAKIGANKSEFISLADVLPSFT